MYFVKNKKKLIMTSIEWLFENLWDEPKDKLTWHSILNKAKEMHKQEVIDAWNSAGGGDAYHQGKEYYQETFVSKGSDDIPMERKLLKSGFVDIVPKEENHIADISKMVEDDVEKLALKYIDDEWSDADDTVRFGIEVGFKIGYNKAKETLYTEEQTLEFAKWLASNWIPLHVTKEYLWEYDELDLSKIPQDYRGYKTEKQLFDIFQSVKKNAL